MEYMKFTFAAFVICLAASAAAQSPEGTAADKPLIYVNTEVAPRFPGGETQLLQYIAHETHYPDKSRQRGEQGVVLVQFIVNEDGHVTDATVLRGVSRLLDAEAIRVVESMPRWEPAWQNGKPVKVYHKLPFRFALEGVEEEAPR